MDVAAWLRDLGLEQYEPAFHANDIDADVLPKLTAEDLIGLGVTSIGHRRKLLDAIAGLRNGTSPATAPAAEAEAEPATAAAAPRSPEAERRQLTVLFCDLVGSTELATRLDPEDLRGVIAAYHRACAGVIGRYEGRVADFLGDGVLAYFGYPRAHEDDAERAVRAGLELVEAGGALKPRDDLTLRVRVGIATGLVVVGDLIGEGAAREEAVVGTTPNLAARLQALAAPGSVVIAPGTRRLVDGLFDLADLGAHDLKGFAERVPAWRVLGSSAAESRFDARQGAGLAPLVGREEELALLLRRWAQAKAGEGQVVLLSGEPGIGKSRLLRTLRERLTHEPHTPLNHYGSPYHANSALHPVIGLLERAAGLRRGDPPERQLDRLEAMLALAAEDVREVAPLLAELLSIPTGGRYPPLDLSPQRKKELTLQALLDQLVGLASRQPVLAVFEDMHWADPSTLELLGRVVDRVQGLPALAVVTFRPGFAPPGTGRGHVTALSLSRLDRRQGAALVERLTGGGTLPALIAEQIVAKADGVPLFIEELTKAVSEAWPLRDGGERHDLAGPLPPLAIPATLHDSLMARLDRLGPAKEVAQVGAVIGREFGHALLAAVVPLDEAALQEALDRLVASELVFRRGMPPEGSYSFKHALVQDAAYQSLLRSRRRQLHARIVRVLEGRFAGAVATEPELLARHCTEAGLPEKAVEHWHRAGQRAIHRSALAEAVADLTAALGLLAGLPDGPERRRKELELQMASGGALTMARGWTSPEAERAYLRARELCRQLGEPPQLSQVLYGLATLYEYRGEYPRSQALIEERLRLPDLAQDAVAFLESHELLACSLFHQGIFAKAVEHADLGLANYGSRRRHRPSAGGPGDLAIKSQTWAAYALWFLGYPERALGRAGEALAEAREAGHAYGLSTAQFRTALLHQLRGEEDAAGELVEASLALANERGFPHRIATGMILKGWGLAVQDRTDGGIGLIHEGLAACRQGGSELDRPYYLALLADAQGRCGRTAEGLAALDEALAMVRSSRSFFYEAELHRLKGSLLLRAGGPWGDAADEAEAHFRRALDVARRQEARSLELRAATSLARLWRDQGKRAEARDLLAPVYAWFTEGFDTPDLQDAKALLDELG